MKHKFFWVFSIICVFGLAGQLVAATPRLLVSLPGIDPDEVSDLAGLGFDVLGYMSQNGGQVYLMTDRRGVAQLKKMHYRPTIEADDIEQSLAVSLGSGSYGKSIYRPGDVIVERLFELERQYPDLVKVYDIGDTWEKVNGLGGHDVYAVKLSDHVALEEPTEPEILYMGMHHSNEVVTPEVIMFFLEYLLKNYNSHPLITDLVNSRQLWLVPMVNPDGYDYVLKNHYLWRKNRNRNNNPKVEECFGVDINRNYAYAWGYDDRGSSPNKCAFWYRGTAPFSEPESRNIRDLALAHHFVFSMTYHSPGNRILFPWNYEDLNTPDHDLYLAVMAEAVRYSGYEYGNANMGDIYNDNGDADDWLYGEQTSKNKILSMTVEAGLSFWYERKTEILKICQENIYHMLLMAYLAQDPSAIDRDVFPLSFPQP
jgi:hypothetical protein